MSLANNNKYVHMLAHFILVFQPYLVLYCTSIYVLYFIETKKIYYKIIDYIIIISKISYYFFSFGTCILSIFFLQ